MPNDIREPLHYRDFNLRFGAFDETKGSFRVWAEGQTPGGSMRPDDAIERIYDPKVFWDDPAHGVGGLLDDLERRSLERDDLFRLGALLADLALPEGEVRALFQSSLHTVTQAREGLRVRLRIDPVALAHLPWEFMALPQARGEPQDSDFLALRREVSLVRTDTIEAAELTLPNRPTARIVGVLSSPKNQPDLQVTQDRHALEQAVAALNKASGKPLIESIWAKRPATEAALNDALRDGADIFHFGGHGLFDPTTGEGTLLLEAADGRTKSYRAGQLAQVLRGADVRLALLGACQTGRRDGCNVWSGIAPALTRERIPAVIANQFKLLDTSAVLVASRIYHRILSGFTVDEALFEARQSIYQQRDGLEQRDWGTPVLYLREQTGVLFPKPKPAASGAVEGPFVVVSNTFERVEGCVVDVMIGEMTGGRLQIRNKVGVVTGCFTSLKLDRLG